MTLSDLPTPIEALNSLSSMEVLDAVIALSHDQTADSRTRALHLALGDGVALEAAVTIAAAHVSDAHKSGAAWLDDLWAEAEAVRDEIDLSSLITESERACLPEWWGARFDGWSADEAPEIDPAFRAAMGWALLSELLGTSLQVPLAAGDINAAVPVALVGGNAQTRAEALRLVTLVEPPASATRIGEVAGGQSQTLLAVVDPVPLSADGLRERQSAPKSSASPGLVRLMAQAHDALESLQGRLGHTPTLASTDEALERLSEAKVRVSRRLATLPEDRVESLVSAYARLVRRMAVLVAAVDGSDVVALAHQLIALDAADESLNASIEHLLSAQRDEQQSRISNEILLPRKRDLARAIAPMSR